MPANATSVTIGNDGTVSVVLPAQTRAAGSARSSSRASSTRPASTRAGRTCSPRPRPRARRTPARRARTALGMLQQGYVETSNVNVVEELVGDDPDAARLRDQFQGDPDLRPDAAGSGAAVRPRMTPTRHALALAVAVASRWPAARPLQRAPATGRPPVDVPSRGACGRSRSPRAVNNGAIFQAGQYRPLFEDHRARLVGDTLTVQIVEKVSASQKSTSSIDKRQRRRPASPRCRASPAKLVHAARAASTPARATPSPARAAPRAATTSRGTITVTVVEVLPNGHLVVAGEKQIGINQNVDVLRFSGQVDPRDDPARQHAWPRRRSPTCASSSAARASDRRPDNRLAGPLLPDFLPI